MDTITGWNDYDYTLYDIIAEVLSLAMSPPVANPFEINHEFFNELTLHESWILSGAMIEFLHKVYSRPSPYREEGTIPKVGNLFLITISFRGLAKGKVATLYRDVGDD